MARIYRETLVITTIPAQEWLRGPPWPILLRRGRRRGTSRSSNDLLNPMARLTSSSSLPRALRAGTVSTAAPLALAAVGALALGFASTGHGAGTTNLAVDVPKAAVGAYDVDAVHSMVGFKIKHLDVSYTLGRFDKFSGEVVLGATAAESSVRIALDPDSVNTNNEGRDKHLRNQDFLDVKQFPEATFTSTKVADKDADTFSVTGDLTLHGVKKSVAFDMDLVGAKETGERTGFRAGFFGELTINRRDFGIDTYPNEALGDTITLTLAIECAKRK
jgi:polyisoprenoid-binding protein YceI